MPTLAEVQEGFYASLLTVPFHRHLGVVIERTPAGVRVAIPPKPEIVGPDGQHSVAAIYTLGDVASSMQVCEEIAPRALELEMGAVFLTVSTSFQPGAPARGTLEATASLVSGLDQEVGRAKESKKATVEVAATVAGEDDGPAAEHRTRFYVRFMEVSRIQEMAPASSEISRFHGLL
jgi:acyl-coenzyme A thioesterase PaaI-like protein